MANKYLVATGNWNNNTSVWALTDGGAAGDNVPTVDDDVFLTAASGAVVLTINVNPSYKTLTTTGFTGTILDNRLDVDLSGGIKDQALTGNII